MRVTRYQKIGARLTPTARRYFEQAVGRAVEAQHTEVTPEHVLMAMLEEAGGDAEMILRAVDRDPRRTIKELSLTLRGFRANAAAKPPIAESLFRWMSDAWLLASLEWNDTRLRSGALLVQMVVGGGRYLYEMPASLAGISVEAIGELAPEALAGTAEGTEASPSDTVASSSAASSLPTAGPGSALAKFTTSFTDAAQEGRIDPVFGREREIRQMVDVLSRRRKNNPILVGEPGVGKSALVEGLAIAIVRGEVPDALAKVDLRALDLGSLEAGASVKGEFEARLKAVIQEVQGSERPIILFIDEAHTIIGAGNQKGGADAANLLKPALARGQLRTIAATTWAEYKQYFEKDAALERRFQPVKVDEPTESVAVGMLRGLRPLYERAHDVIIRDEAVVAAVELSHRYITGRQLPDKAVDLLDTTAARVRVGRSGRPDQIVALDAELASLTRQRDALKRDLADVSSATGSQALADVQKHIHALEGQRSELMVKWAAQKEALERALATRRTLHDLATKLEEGDRDAAAQFDERESEARDAMTALRSVVGSDSLIAVDVDVDAIARTVEQWTGVPVGAMKDATSKAVLQLGERLSERVVGQDASIAMLTESIRVAQAGLKNTDMPRGVFLLVGPSGVGKTETALAVAEALYGGTQFMKSINLSEYQEKHTASRLVGSPPGYVGHGEGGELTEAVRQRPYSVVLLDECEKAALEVMNTFYQVFDKGVLNDSDGREIDFRNTTIFLTSNLASDLVIDLFEQGKSIDEVADAVRPHLARHFKPALLNRMTVIPYGPLTRETMGTIVDMEIARVKARATRVHGVSVDFAPELREHVVDRCTAHDGGVRFLRLMLEKQVLVPLATELLSTSPADLPGSYSIALADGQICVTPTTDGGRHASR